MRWGIVIAAALACASCAPAAAPVASDEEPAVTHTNHVDYVEFAAQDLSVAKAFYSQAFGWTFQDWGPDYTAFSGAGVEGGIRGGEVPVAGSTLVILFASDLEASERAVVAAGGVVTERHEFPGGRRFHFRDPAGNVLGVWTVVEDGAAP